MKTQRSLILVGALTALALNGAPLEAQRGPGMRGNRAQLEERVRARFGQMVRQRLGLTEEEAQRLGEVMHGFQEARQALMRSEQALRRRVEAFALEGGEDAEEAEALLARMEELREEEVRLFREEQAGLREVLTPPQLLRFLGIREEMNQRIRELRRGGQGPPRRPGQGRRRPGGGADGASMVPGGGWPGT